MNPPPDGHRAEEGSSPLPSPSAGPPMVSRISPAQAREITRSHYLDRPSAAAYIGMSEKFLATHLHDGPKRFRVGSRILYRLSDLENWMRQQEVRN